MSQIPTYLGFVLQKSSDLYTFANTTKQANIINLTTHGAPAAGRQDTNALDNQGIVRNTCASASIVGLRLGVQSSVGSYEFSGEYPFLKGRSELFADTLKNSYLDYCGGSEVVWDRHSCIVFISCSDFARGIGTDGSSFPITVDASVQFENHRQMIDGTGAGSLRAKGPAVLQDVIAGCPVMLALFPRQSLTITAATARLSAQNMSHSSAVEILSRK